MFFHLNNFKNHLQISKLTDAQYQLRLNGNLFYDRYEMVYHNLQNKLENSVEAGYHLFQSYSLGLFSLYLGQTI